jgi:hypothetical protein
MTPEQVRNIEDTIEEAAARNSKAGGKRLAFVYREDTPVTREAFDKMHTEIRELVERCRATGLSWAQQVAAVRAAGWTVIELPLVPMAIMGDRA